MGDNADAQPELQRSMSTARTSVHRVFQAGYDEDTLCLLFLFRAWRSMSTARTIVHHVFQAEYDEDKLCLLFRFRAWRDWALEERLGAAPAHGLRDARASWLRGLQEGQFKCKLCAMVDELKHMVEGSPTGTFLKDLLFVYVRHLPFSVIKVYSYDGAVVRCSFDSRGSGIALDYQKNMGHK